MKHAYIAVILALLGNSIFAAQPISHTETKQLSEISCTCRDNGWSPCHINVAFGQEDALVEELNKLLTSRIDTYNSGEAARKKELLLPEKERSLKQELLDKAQEKVGQVSSYVLLMEELLADYEPKFQEISAEHAEHTAALERNGQTWQELSDRVQEAVHKLVALHAAYSVDENYRDQAAFIEQSPQHVASAYCRTAARAPVACKDSSFFRTAESS